MLILLDIIIISKSYYVR